MFIHFLFHALQSFCKAEKLLVTLSISSWKKVDSLRWRSHILKQWFKSCFAGILQQWWMLLSCAVRMAAIWPQQQRGRHFLSTPSLDQHILSPHTDTHTQIRKYRWTHTRTHTNTKIQTDTHTHKYTRTSADTHSHAQTQTHTDIHANTRRHTLTPRQHTSIHPCTDRQADTQ